MLDNAIIGKRILELRKGNALTQVELSNIVGVSLQAVSKWEQGECLPDIEVLLKLGQFFNKTIEELLLGEMNNVNVIEESAKQPDLWTKSLDEIRKIIPERNFDTWFKNTNAEYLDGIYIIYCSNKFAADWLRQRYSPFISEIIEGITGESTFALEFRSTDQYSTYLRPTINLEEILSKNSATNLLGQRLE